LFFAQLWMSHRSVDGPRVTRRKGSGENITKTKGGDKAFASLFFSALSLSLSLFRAPRSSVSIWSWPQLEQSLQLVTFPFVSILFLFTLAVFSGKEKAMGLTCAHEFFL